MSETPKQVAERLGLPLELVEYRRTYGQLFPADNPLSPLMLRLMIIRDDVSFEIEGLALNADDDSERVWRNTYFMRRLSSSIHEARNVLRQPEFGKFIKKQWKNTIVDSKLKELEKKTDVLDQLFGPLRDDLGGHVRPAEAVAGLRTHKDWSAVIVRNLASAFGTTYRELTVIATLFVWPEVVDQETYAAKHEAVSTALPRAAGALVNVIDGLLQAFWTGLPGARMDVPKARPHRRLKGAAAR